MSDAPITLAEMIAEAERAVYLSRWLLPCTTEAGIRAPMLRRIAVMEEIVRYLQRETETAEIAFQTAPDIRNALDERGRCCGRKPVSYRKGTLGHPYLFCPRCGSRYEVETGAKIPETHRAARAEERTS